MGTIADALSKVEPILMDRIEAGKVNSASAIGLSDTLYATAPYGHHLQTYFQDEVVPREGRYFVNFVRYRQDGATLIEIERKQDPGPGHASLNEAIEAAEAGRKQFLDTDAEEVAYAAEVVRKDEYAYQTQGLYDPSPDWFSEPAGWNTRIEYFYRDASNFKHYGAIVVAGVLSEQEIGELQSKLRCDCFIPKQVGMQPLHVQLQTLGKGDDDAWHEIDNISLTEEPVTVTGTAQELLARFKAADWDSAVSDIGHSSSPAP